MTAGVVAAAAVEAGDESFAATDEGRETGEDATSSRNFSAASSLAIYTPSSRTKRYTSLHEDPMNLPSVSTSQEPTKSRCGSRMRKA